MRAGLLVSALSSVLAGCGGYVHDERLDGSWRLVAIDVREDMMLCRRYGEADCVGDQLPGPTVFAAGADARYVVFARHPRGEYGPDRHVSENGTEYYYVLRHAETVPVRRGDVVGPFDRERFEAEKRRLGLPEFSREFEDLR